MTYFRSGMAKRRAVLFYLAIFACIAAEWLLFKTETGIKYSSSAGTLLKVAGDVALILLPYWLLAPRFRWAAILPVPLYAVWCVVNLTYFRFWGDLIPAAAVSMGGNLDVGLMGFGISLLRWNDVGYLVIIAFAFGAWFVFRPSAAESFCWKEKGLALAISILAGVGGQYSYLKTSIAWSEGESVGERSFLTDVKNHYAGGYSSYKPLYIRAGMVWFGVRYLADIMEILSASGSLSGEEVSEISDFLSLYARNGGADGADMVPDSVNVVYIIMESLNADMIGKKIGERKVMPVLDSLSTLPGTVYFDNVVSQIKASSSSDGHLLLLTGLLPPDKMAYSITYGSSNKFPSLADAMPNHEKYLLLADDGVYWNEGNTLQNFGLGHPIVDRDRSRYDIGSKGRDGAMFDQAIDMMKNIRQPFFLTLMTIAMHIPFREKGCSMTPFIAEAKGLSTGEKDYANVCHITDAYIGKFLASLPPNTVVIIASDHSQGLQDNSDTSPAAVYMAVNTGTTAHISRQVGQVNLFPATLDILGIRSSYGGLAPSALNPYVDGTRDSYGNIYGSPSEETLDTLDRAYRISDMIIRGDYFKKL